MNQEIETKKKNNNTTVSILSSLIIFVIGIALIFFNKDITSRGVVIVAGILFIITGIVNLLVFVNRKDSNGKQVNKGFSLIFGWAVSICAVLLGASMLFFIPVFISLIPSVFGILIFFGAIVLGCIYIFGTHKIISTPIWMWIFPLLMIVAGIITFIQKPIEPNQYNDSLIMILTGSALIVYSVANVILLIMLSITQRKLNKKEIVTTSKDDSTPQENV